MDRPWRDIVRHSLVYGLGNTASALVGLILVPVYAHYLPPEEFGLFALWLSVYGVLGLLYDLGMQNSVGRFFFERPVTSASPGSALAPLFSTASVFLLFYAGSLSALLWWRAADVSSLLTGSPAHAVLARILALALFADILAMVPLTVMRMEERSVRFVVLSAARAGTALGLNLLLVVGLGWGVRGAMLSNAVSSLTMLLFLAPEFARRARAAPVPALLKRMLGFGLPFVPVPLSVWVIDYSDRYLLELLRSRHELGLYALGYRIAQLVQLAVTAFSMGWAPIRFKVFSRADAPEIYSGIAKNYLILMSTFCLVVSLLAEEVVTAVAPAAYAQAAGVVGLLAWAYGLYGLFLIMVTGMGVTMRTTPMAWITMGAAAVNLILNLLLIPRFGMLAAACTTVVANGVLAGGAWMASQRVYPIPYRWKPMAGIGGLAAALGLWGRLSDPSSPVWGCIHASVLLAVWILILRLSGQISLGRLKELSGAPEVWGGGAQHG